MVKCTVLPQFLFLFQSLPIEIPKKKSLFGRGRSLDLYGPPNPIGYPSHNLVNHLVNPLNRVDFSLPVLYLYYNASQIRVVYYYLHDHTAKNWVQIEESAVTPFVLSDIVWNPPKDRPKLNYDNSFLRLTLNIWDKMRLKLTNPMSPLTSFLSQTWFQPAVGPNSYPVWKKHKITRLKDVTNIGKQMSKSNWIRNVKLIFLGSNIYKFRVCFQANWDSLYWRWN